VGIVIIVWLAAAIISTVIWRITLKHGGAYSRIRRIHLWLAVLTPTALIVFNIISRKLTEPHTTLLWAYFITPLATALPFVASLAGLCNAKQQRKGESGPRE
jgi:lipoprotein signal peptidase